ncbi:MAG: hypothetical protein CFE23_14835 [Flavobacterium sp. BFFFF1]|uniref:STING domain-containing protein n=1 Tax=unclassified Flavobacterium TaxID=196869 RepID=UPI000BD133B2|nr:MULTISPECIES: STING domain-containing protein [unclassified Flavobacterium]OYU79261.1 MAG: hypothetical protein CFE23_14835 [Flavobacterium sp. BFFFF1]
MDFIPNIFIGSSTEGKAVAEKIKDQLASFADCKMWTQAFELGKSNFENLSGQIAFYDYAILVATGDDVIVSRKRKQKTSRDNILFEFGLFTGGLGASRVFYMMEEEIKIPTDLYGITLPFFPSPKEPDFDTAIVDCANKIKEHIETKEKTFDLGFLPSTALAYGYFTNFLVRTIEGLLEDQAKKRKFTIGNNDDFEIMDLKFTVLIPDDLSDDMFSKVKAKRLKGSWDKLNVTTGGIRDYDFSVDVSKAINGELHLIDIPLTLNALNKAIELYSKKQHLGKDFKETILEEREIRNFRRALEYLISKNTFTKDIVNVEVVGI